MEKEKFNVLVVDDEKESYESVNFMEKNERGLNCVDM